MKNLATPTLILCFFGSLIFCFNSLFISPPPVHAAFSPDINGDGVVNSVDASIIITKFGSPYTFVDYAIMLAKFGETTTPVDPNHIYVGARFYMAYFSKNARGQDVHNTQEQWLSDPQWKDIWPYYTIIRSNTQKKTVVDIHQDNQQIFDQEIQLAAAAGLDYWALETNPISPKFNLELYLNSPYKNKLKFALITPMSPYDTIDQWNMYVTSVANYFKDPQYLKVKDQQPLLYIEQTDPLIKKIGIPETTRRMTQFISQIQSITGHKPYLVLLNWDTQDTDAIAKSLSFNARALYNCRDYQIVHGAPYSSLVAGCESRWNVYKQSDLNFVPTVQTNYDIRSKKGTDAIWYQRAKPQEIATHLRHAIDWVKTNADKSDAKVVLITAWSDYTEGGWLEPTISEGNARLNAISKILGGKTMVTPTSPYATNPPTPHPQGKITLDSKFKNNMTFPANQPIVITGNATTAIKMYFKLHTSQLSFLNGPSNYYDPPTEDFTLTLPALPPGGPYTLSVTSPDAPTVTVNNIKIK